MCDMYNTEIPALLVEAMKAADKGEAERLFDDADFCGRKLLEGLMSTGRLLSGMSDRLDPRMWELRSLGDSIAVTAELIAGFSEVAETYHLRVKRGEISGGNQTS